MVTRILMAGLPASLATWLEARVEAVTVQHAATGAETMDLLERGHWSLLIIDHGVSDPSAMAVLSWARTGLKLIRLPVLFCLSPRSGPELADRLVKRLGVRNLLSSPVDREELAQQVASTLGLNLLEGDLAPLSSRQGAAAVGQLWERFKDAAMGRVAVLEQAALALLDGTLNRNLRQEASREAQRLAGSISSFGFVLPAQVAKEVESLLESDGDLDTAHALRLSELVVELKEQLDQTVSAPEADSAAGDSRPLLVVVDEDAPFAERVMAEARESGMRVAYAASAQQADRLLDGDVPDVVLLDMSTSDKVEEGLSLLKKCGSRLPVVPCVVAGGAAMDRVEIARLGGRGFLEKPLTPGQVLEAIAQVMRQPGSRSRVLVVDPDTSTLDEIMALLSTRGLKVVTLQDPLKFWKTMEEVVPELVLMSLDLPYVNGMELGRSLRHHDRWSGVPLLFLTNGLDPETVHRVFAAGADDYVSKPIMGPELVARVFHRLERVQLLRSLLETDPLTGAVNRQREVVPKLQQLLRLAARKKQPFCMAQLEISDWKEINEKHGHSAGDEVLRWLGGLLLRSFRGEDVVSRWSSREFVVGMYGMARGDGLQRLISIARQLSSTSFTAPDGTTFNVTCCAGVAQHPMDGSTLNELHRGADEAMARARAIGPNKVMAANPRELPSPAS